jgi:hypothetical protein
MKIGCRGHGWTLASDSSSGGDKVFVDKVLHSYRGTAEHGSRGGIMGREIKLTSFFCAISSSVDQGTHLSPPPLGPARGWQVSECPADRPPQR